MKSYEQDNSVAGKSASVEARRTPIENFIQRIETLTDRTREARCTIGSIVDRLVGNEEETPNKIGQDRPDSSPGEYNTMNYAIDTLTQQVDQLQNEISRMHDRL